LLSLAGSTGLLGNFMLDKQDKKMLEDLVLDPLLEELEARIEKFNIFEAIGAVRQESRHSDFLAFLLHPTQNHGLGDVFLKRLLQKAIAYSENNELSITQIDLDIWDLSQAEVLREWDRIDIFVLDQTNQLVTVIENKISSKESTGQLKRYREKIERLYPNFKKIFLYLTPDGDDPSDKIYLRLDYSLICELVENLANSRASILGTEVVTVMKHYTEMLRRHIVSESEIAELCQKIYTKHQRALDLIFERRPDIQALIRKILEDLINENDELVPDHYTKGEIRFAVKQWDTVPKLLEADRRSKRMLFFDFHNEPTKLSLHLYIGPGPNDTRENIHKIAVESKTLFNKAGGKLGTKWKTIYKNDFLKAKDYEDVDKEELQKKIENQWNKFITKDLPAIKEVIDISKLG